MSLDPPHHGLPWALNDIWVEFVTPHFINLFSFYSSNYQVGEGNRGHLLHGLRRKQAKWALEMKHEDGGGIGRGDHFLFYKFIERTTER